MLFLRWIKYISKKTYKGLRWSKGLVSSSYWGKRFSFKDINKFWFYILSDFSIRWVPRLLPPEGRVPPTSTNQEGSSVLTANHIARFATPFFSLPRPLPLLSNFSSTPWASYPLQVKIKTKRFLKFEKIISFEQSNLGWHRSFKRPPPSSTKYYARLYNIGNFIDLYHSNSGDL